MVYVKPISVDALPRNVRDQAAGLKELFAVIDSEGQQLALVADRNMALALAVQNDYAPQPLH
jgi:hypothetical protein